MEVMNWSRWVRLGVKVSGDCWFRKVSISAR